jgi:hypothetical protein
MNKKLKLACAWIAIMLIIMACINIGNGLSEEEKLQTAVAETLQVIQSENAEDTNSDTEVALPTITTAPTNTPKGPPTNTPEPCNRAVFVSETIEDGADYAPNANFTKTWRLRNDGTCAWNTNYKLVFFNGDQMSGPATKNLTQSVDPGEIVDISVDLIAPAGGGNYKGYWKIADDDGAYYVNNIWVEIEVIAPAAPPPLPPAIAALTLNYVKAEGGSVRTGGAVHGALHNVGDTGDNRGSQVFASFDTSGIPAGSTITEVIVDFTDYDKLSDPWGSLNCLRMYSQDFGILDGADYFAGAPLGALVRWCNDGDLGASQAHPDMIAALQSKVGSNRFQVRLQFKDLVHDGDGLDDMVRFGAMKLHVTYELP